MYVINIPICLMGKCRLFVSSLIVLLSCDRFPERLESPQCRKGQPDVICFCSDCSISHAKEKRLVARILVFAWHHPHVHK